MQTLFTIYLIGSVIGGLLGLFVSSSNGNGFFRTIIFATICAVFSWLSLVVFFISGKATDNQENNELF